MSEVILFFNIDKSNFLKGIKYSVYVILIVFLLFIPVYFLLLKGTGVYSVSIFTIFSGGLLLLISGCIGPGRYFKEYPTFLIQPKTSDSFYEQIPISIFNTDPEVKKGQVFINNSMYKIVEINEKYTQFTISRDEVDDKVINNLWIETEKGKSNSVSFTFFDFDETMTHQEIERYEKYDKLLPNVTLDDLYNRYMLKINSNMGSLMMGFLFSGISVLLFGFLIENSY